MYVVISKSDSVTRSIIAHLPEEQSCQISSRSDLNLRSVAFFEKRRPNKKKNYDKSSDIGSVPDSKID